MKKLIRYAAAAFATWAIVTYAWAAFSHVTGFVGPAQASASSLGFVANAMELLDPPGALGAPQRFAATRIRDAARTAERVHGNAERTMGEFVDRLGHDRAHRGDRRRHRHRHGRGSDFDDIVVRLNAIGQAGNVRVLELQERRATIGQERIERLRERALERAERARERGLRAAERARERAQRAAERGRRHAGEDGERRFKFDFKVGDEDLRFIREFEHVDGEALALDTEAMMAEIEASFENLELDLDASLDKKKMKERIEKLLDMLEKLNDR